MLAYLIQKAANATRPVPQTTEVPLKPPLRTQFDLAPIKDLLDHQSARNWSLQRLARIAGYSPFHFLRAFRIAFHETPNRYLVRRRLDKARQLLADSDLTVTEICFAVGFQSLGSFSSLFRQVVGWAPSHYRARVLAQRQNPLSFIPGCHQKQWQIRCKPQFSRSSPIQPV